MLGVWGEREAGLASVRPPLAVLIGTQHLSPPPRVGGGDGLRDLAKGAGLGRGLRVFQSKMMPPGRERREEYPGHNARPGQGLDVRSLPWRLRVVGRLEGTGGQGGGVNRVGSFGALRRL